MADRRPPTTPDTSREQVPEPVEARPRPAARPDAPVEVEQPIAPPEAPVALDAPDTAEALPATDRPLAESVDSVAGDEMGLSGPEPADRDEIADIGGEAATAEDLAGELDGLLDAPDRSGGLDGRNPAADGGQGPGPQPGEFHPDGSDDPDLTVDTTMGANPANDAGLGDGSAAGKLTPEQQERVDEQREIAMAAARRGDFDAADDAAAEVQRIVSGKEMISNFGSLRSGPQQVWDATTGEVVEVDSLRGVGHESFVSESVQMERTGTDADGDGGDGSGQPPATGGGVEDRAPEGEAPDRHRDFTDAFLESKLVAERHGDVDPHPDDVGGVAPGAPPTDITAPVEQYEEGYVSAPRYDIDDVDELHHDLAPEEEFLEH